MQDEHMGCHGTDHGEAEPQCADRSQARKDQSDGASHFHHAGDDAEPLTESDLLEQVDHEGNAGQFGETGSEESCGEDTLQSPCADAARGTAELDRSCAHIRLLACKVEGETTLRCRRSWQQPIYS